MPKVHTPKPSELAKTIQAAEGFVSDPLVNDGRGIDFSNASHVVSAVAPDGKSGVEWRGKAKNKQAAREAFLAENPHAEDWTIEVQTYNP